ncbi:hypothetical protein AVEN_29914-1 [Araneus ventricosus]|uniref:Uncharacterized protein n=1 Tax=Araneus ventricosus TaxID=182803 RepID=A0A4Y2L1E9_ARAVE|nr:hypothetical protein AVEN_29914-1 [Araneus ventricosus]
MPPKRQNIGRRTNAAKRKREERQSETEEETSQRNEGNTLHMSQSHATESSQQHEERNEASRVRIWRINPMIPIPPQTARSTEAAMRRFRAPG